MLKGSLLEPLEVASGKLSLQFDYWRVWYEKALKWVSPFVILVHVVLFGPYYLLFWTGKVDVATITGTSTYTTTSKGRTTTHYVIHAALSEKMGQRPVKTEARFGDYLRAKNGEIKKSTWLYTPVTSWLTQSGDKPVIGAAAVVLSCLIALFSVILVLVFKHGSRPWYEQRKVNEKGQGKLFVHAWAAQEPGRPGLYAARKPKS